MIYLIKKNTIYYIIRLGTVNSNIEYRLLEYSI